MDVEASKIHIYDMFDHGVILGQPYGNRGNFVAHKVGAALGQRHLKPDFQVYGFRCSGCQLIRS
jgi:hypothetical protein